MIILRYVMIASALCTSLSLLLIPYLIPAYNAKSVKILKIWIWFELTSMAVYLITVILYNIEYG